MKVLRGTRISHNAAAPQLLYIKYNMRIVFQMVSAFHMEVGDFSHAQRCEKLISILRITLRGVWGIT